MRKPKRAIDNIRLTWTFIEAITDRYNDAVVVGALTTLTKTAIWLRHGDGFFAGSEADGGLPIDEIRLCRICGLTMDEWTEHRDNILCHFRQEGNRLYPPDKWIDVKRGPRIGFKRPAIPAGIRSQVMARDKWICVYCGNDQGPFDLDHVIPISRGGHATDIANLVCACATCNRSKHAKAPEEWLA